MIDVPAEFSKFYNASSNIIAATANDEVMALHAESHQLFRSGVEDIKIIRREKLTLQASSFAKDSTNMTLIALKAHIELMEEGVLDNTSPFMICNTDTGVESSMVQLLAHQTIDEISQFCKANNVNLIYRQATPPIAKQWASLFLSGNKVLSTSRVSNDCSMILKIEQAARVYKELSNTYGKDIVTLLGSRISESTKRKTSIIKYGHDKQKASDLIDVIDKRQVFLPIVSMTSKHIWYILNHAGTNPVKPSYNGENFFSYAENHRLLRLVYSEAEDASSCPESDIKLKGAGSPGGCGGNARYGCHLCLKSKRDNSNSQLNKQARHNIISGNIEKVRNWLMYVGQDITKRVWHSRAVDPLTMAVGMVPNVLAPEIYDDAIRLLSQVTFDDRMRAKKWTELVKQSYNDPRILAIDSLPVSDNLKASQKKAIQLGIKSQDEGYADILNDTTMDSEDKKLLLSVYEKHATKPIINPMSREIAMYLSAIHSRDGIKLPPYRALWLWEVVNKAEQEAHAMFDLSQDPNETFWDCLEKVKANQEKTGVRIPYPDVNVDDARVDDIPDAKMLFPPSYSSILFTHLDQNMAELDAQDGCTVEKKDNLTNRSVSEVKHLLNDDQIAKLKSSGESQVDLRYIRKLKIGESLRNQPLSSSPKLTYSRRPITKAKRKGDKITVQERGRTSLNTPSFADRKETPQLHTNLVKDIEILVPGSNYRFDWFGSRLEEIDYSGAGYAIDDEAFDGWFDYGGYERAMAMHQESTKGKDDIYAYTGTGVFYDLVRWGVLSLTDNSRNHACRIINRTNYFREIGIFNLSYEELLEQSMPMPEYRNFKAKLLLEVRAKRNTNRKTLKDAHTLYWKDPVAGEIKKAEALTDELISIVYEAQFKAAMAGIIKKNHARFDHIEYTHEHTANLGLLTKLDRVYSTPEEYLKFSRASDPKRITNNVQSKLLLTRDLQANHKRLLNSKRKALLDAKLTLQGSTDLQLMESWKVMFSMSMLFEVEHALSYAALIDKQINQLDKQVKSLGNEQFKKVFSLKDESVTGLLASELF